MMSALGYLAVIGLVGLATAVVRRVWPEAKPPCDDGDKKDEKK
jgi:hypothetical protein